MESLEFCFCIRGHNFILRLGSLILILSTAHNNYLHCLHSHCRLGLFHSTISTVRRGTCFFYSSLPSSLSFVISIRKILVLQAFLMREEPHMTFGLCKKFHCTANYFSLKEIKEKYCSSQGFSYDANC